MDHMDTIRRIDGLIRSFTLRLESASLDYEQIASYSTSIESLANARVALAGPWVESEETSK